jgi:hypothetical protein
MKLLRSFPISPMFAFQPSAGPARGKGDRRAMAVIHTASRRGRLPTDMFLFCSRFKCKDNGEMRGRIAFAPSVPLKEKVVRCCFRATPFGRKVR